eukprot:882659-Pyramimonas_sp.AAC.1
MSPQFLGGLHFREGVLVTPWRFSNPARACPSACAEMPPGRGGARGGVPQWGPSSLPRGSGLGGGRWDTAPSWAVLLALLPSFAF